MMMTLALIFALLFSCNRDATHSWSQSHKPSKYHVFMQGASITGGFGASFSMEQALQTLVECHSEMNGRRIEKSLTGGKILFAFDQFYPTVFPYSHLSGRELENKVIEALRAMSNFDVIFVAPLPNYVFLNRSHEYKARGPLIKAAKMLARKKDFRDTVNRVIANYTASHDNYHLMPLEEMLNKTNHRNYRPHWVDIPLKNVKLFDDFVHLNDLGQAAVIHELLIPTLNGWLGGAPLQQLPYPTQNNQWRSLVQSCHFSDHESLGKDAAGSYLFHLSDNRQLRKPKRVRWGNDISKMPFGSHLQLGLITQSNRFFASKDKVNMVLTIPPHPSDQRPHELILDLSQSLAYTPVTLTWSPEYRGYVGYGRDFYASVAYAMTNYRFIAKLHQTEGRLSLIWETYPRLRGQDKQKLRIGSLSQWEQDNIEKLGNALTRLEYSLDFTLATPAP